MTDATGRPLGGRYRMEAPLAAGGMGEVWAARDLLLDRAVAVKVLGGAFAGDGRAAERLRREARAAGRLEHPAIARVLDLGEDGGRPYLVMELLEGESLAERIARTGPTEPAAAARVVAAVADALETAHRAGVVHRDVKPGNVFLTSDGGVKVLDFGIASAAGDTTLTTGDLLGTAAYLAPERALGHRATAASDVYALGVVLYELLAGRRPFEAGSDIEQAMAHVNADPVPLALLAPAAPAPLVAACEQAMAKDPSARPRSAAAFARLVAEPGPAHSSAVVTRAVVTRTLGATAPVRPRAPVTPAYRRWGPIREGSLPGRRGRRAVHTPRARRRGLIHSPRARRRGLLVALVVAGAVLAALPAVAGGLLSWPGGRIEEPFVVRVPELTLPGSQAPGQAADGRDVAADPAPAEAADPSADDQPARGDHDDHDQDDDSSGSGRSGGGGSGGGGGSSGPG
jgi:eukaryotic-like serine/threonine-protein kinase